ncbi:MAG TPA: adenylate/guanylate cyclase domain-containing protein [Candidatus Limnocylindria bacterium]|nr:adenylate/guanylate cyclase domain-containing protein [Candidatus Limnocylindria bacterium]
MRSFPWRAIAALALVLLPTLFLLFLLRDGERNAPWFVPVEHFVITTNVSIVAALVAILAARAALQSGHYRSLLIAVGFLCMAGIFAVHGLSTPGVLQRGDKEGDAGLVVGLSAQLALLTSAIFFAIRYTPLAAWMAQRVPPRALLTGVVAAIALYAVVAIGWPGWFGGVARWMLVTGGASYDYEPSSYGYAGYRVPDPFGGAGLLPFVLAGGTVVLFGYAAWAQGRDWARTRLPLQGALAASYVLLAQAQLSQLLGPVWTPSWWEYHGLMFAATVVALGALFLELDRRRGLERFLPPTVVERVVSGDPLRLEGERQTVTILFADLRGSTALAERLRPEEIVAVLNTYLRIMARAVIDEGGILDKFLGDGLMAIFGAMGDQTHGAAAAARAALAMRSRITSLNAERGARGEPVVLFGVGMHTGDVVLGAVGLPERSDYTAIGDTVNTASRMESLTKEYQVDAVLSSDTAGHLHDDGIELRALGLAQVRGKAAAVEVFTLS